MKILGLNIFHGDSSACLVVDGKLLSAAEEERFTRIKHSSEFPFNSIKFCLEKNNLDIQDIDYISVNYNYKYNFISRLLFLIKNLLKVNFISNRTDSIIETVNIKKKLENYFEKEINAKYVFVPHHLAHAYSTLYFLEENKNSLIFSFDGSGDFSTIESYLVKNNKLELIKKNLFPNSLGFFYSAFTQFLGFHQYGDEYKFMGLAGYGKPTYYDEVKKLIISQDPFKLNMKYFNLPKVDYSNKYPKYNNLLNEKFELYFKKKFNFFKINYDDQKSKDLACSVQKVLEECVFTILKNIKNNYNLDKVYLVGGCAFNSSLVGKLIQSNMFEKVKVETNPGDAGGAVGSAFYTCHKNNIDISKQPNTKFLGPQFSSQEIKDCVINKLDLRKYKVNLVENFNDLSLSVAKIIHKENIIFWFQDKMEWGPRALGNRSILANPMSKDIKDILNKKVKKRELFRPFAPSVLEDYADKYFVMNKHNSPNMNIVFEARKETKDNFPEIVHIDNTSRVQTVSKSDNEKFYKLLEDFNNLTGCPILINTSMNIKAPIVLSPEQAFNTFSQTEVNTLVLNNWLIQRI